MAAKVDDPRTPEVDELVVFESLAGLPGRWWPSGILLANGVFWTAF